MAKLPPPPNLSQLLILIDQESILSIHQVQGGKTILHVRALRYRRSINQEQMEV